MAAAGIVNLVARGIGLRELQDVTFWQGSFGRTPTIKLMLAAAILLGIMLARGAP